MTINMWIATLAWGCLLVGYILRYQRHYHVPLVLTGIFLDIALVLYLQVTREAIQTAVKFSLTPLQQTHVGLSTAALLLYFPVLFLGFKLVRGAGSEVRAKHKKLAIAAFTFRTLGFFFMFSMWNMHKAP